MKHYTKILLVIAALMGLGMNVNAQSAQSNWEEGSGTKESPYLIKTTGDLNKLAKMVNNGTDFNDSFFRLENDLDFTGKEFTPIGKEGDDPERYDDYHSFLGTFDGNGKTISGININQPGVSNIGLFGYGFNGKIKNLTLDNCTFVGCTGVGAIVGYAENASGGLIENCFVSNTVTVKGEGFVGGLAGSLTGWTIKNCFSAATVELTSDDDAVTAGLGAIAGPVSECTITNNCYYPNSVAGKNAYIDYDSEPFVALSDGCTPCYAIRWNGEGASDGVEFEFSGESGASSCFKSDGIYYVAEGIVVTVKQVCEVENEPEITVQIDNGTSTFTMPDRDINLLLIAEPQYYTITCEGDGAEGIAFTFPDEDSYQLSDDGIYSVVAETEVTGTVKHNCTVKVGETEVEVTPGTEEGTYTFTFTMPAENVTITVNIIVEPVNITLANAADNTATLEDYDGKKVDSVTLSDRALFKDGSWNTLCLPFDVDLNDASYTDAATELCLYGAEVRRLDTDNTKIENKKLTLQFKEFADNIIKAGVPFLVKWTSGENVVNPTFKDVTINSQASTTDTAEGYISFIGNYKPITLTANNKDLLYLGSGNTLYWPAQNITLNAFRAYFDLLGDYEAGSGAGANIVSEFLLDFGNGDATRIADITDGRIITADDATWYMPDGRRLGAKPTTPGLYIVGGKKVVVK